MSMSAAPTSSYARPASVVPGSAVSSTAKTDRRLETFDATPVLAGVTRQSTPRVTLSVSRRRERRSLVS